ncbi:salicylate esterase [Pseudonocardia sp. Ae168_Ps1]|uniref:alpha/beta fold hydrolase n=1 Tax=unclassified Pseudonocardia TaxID=2619320 RepID=UPI00094AEEC8|nr:MULTISPECIES: alpha/beta hydrolase [unclassified Pseudonocardia]OLL75362.1 salicylate esterase [Pseudonocardia sp. Ae150A_Ps1]OLL81357.1 salicylate esterase [Pseudonocardia sp. Ae168_Ps1]OLL84529.1 salicylate esterase [Pseudonocardia sp. Ae263_Ps1]OLL95451.1 salicylate esterase [Pseudonocardia sp. Ae356_Ps1]
MTTFVLVHGGFVGGWFWDDVAPRLEKSGHRVEVVEQLPSAGPDPAALGDLADDVEVVTELVERTGDDVVLVGHSYGGMVVTELADHPRVVHSVYVCAAWPARDQSMMDLLTRGGPPPGWVAPYEDGTLRATDDLELLRQVLCADVEKVQAEAGLRRMMPQSISSAVSVSSAPERTHPTTYVVTEQDEALPPEQQEEMAAAADHVERLPSSHHPTVSMPDQLAVILGRVH